MNKTRAALSGVILFAVIFSLLLLFWTPANTDNSHQKKAADFTLTTFDGEKITLSKLKDKPVVLNFWASWCGPCREEGEALEATWQKYKDKIYFLGLNYRDNKKDALAFIKEFKVTYPNGPDEDNISSDYGLTGVPETFVVNTDGEITEHILGATTLETLSEAIDKVL